jgi:hypothetical protein
LPEACPHRRLTPEPFPIKNCTTTDATQDHELEILTQIQAYEGVKKRDIDNDDDQRLEPDRLLYHLPGYSY